MTLRQRLETGIQAYKGSDKLYFSLDPLLASIKKDMLEVIGEDEKIRWDDYKDNVQLSLAKNKVKAELRERLERYIG